MHPINRLALFSTPLDNPPRDTSNPLCTPLWRESATIGRWERQTPYTTAVVTFLPDCKRYVFGIIDRSTECWVMAPDYTTGYRTGMIMLNTTQTIAARYQDHIDRERFEPR